MQPSPAQIPLQPGLEINVRADRVSVEYRRWLIELVRAARQGGGRPVAEALATAASGDTSFEAEALAR